MMRRWAPLLLALSCGCTAAQRWTASRRDYALYRDTRLAASVEQRLATSHRYLREEPEGRFRAEVQRWFQSAEPRFYATARDRPSLLRAYLRAMPDGPHAKGARDRLQELELLREYRLEQERREAARVREAEATLARAEHDRRAFVAEILELAAAVATVEGFGAPVSALGGKLGQRLKEPAFAPSCTPARCVTTFTRTYAIPENRQIVERRAELALALELRQGLLARVSFGGPLLFSRLAEAIDLAPVSVTDLGARAEAIGRTAQVLGNALEPIFPSAECNRDAVAPSILVRECRGVRLDVRAGIALGDFDRVEVAPAQKARP